MRVLNILFSILFLFLSESLMGSEWLNDQNKDLRVQQGSALDFSPQFVSEMTESKSMKVKSGHLNNGEEFRALCAIVSYTKPRGGFPTHKKSREIAEQLSMQGYNWVEFQMMDAALMAGRNKDFDFDPEQFDRFHYLLSELNKAGIYWQLDMANTMNVAFGDVSQRFETGKHFMQLEVYFDEQARAHWLKYIKKILLTENPYTKLKLFEEPMLARISLVNESALSVLFRSEIKKRMRGQRKGRVNKELRRGLENKFHLWLSKRYGSVKQARDTWFRKDGNRLEATIPETEESTERMADVMRFFTDSGIELYHWMERELRDIGYIGLLSMFNNGNKVMEGGVRRDLSSVAMHSYHDHPRKTGVRTEEGWLSRSQSDTSSITDPTYLGNLMLSRQWGKAFLVEEYDQPFPNRWRREAGLLIPAFGAFQGWDSMCRFSMPLKLGYGESKGKHEGFISAFHIGLDPVAKAGERLAALLFRRGDVEVAKTKWAIQVKPNDIYDGSVGWQNWPRILGRIGLEFGVGISWNKGELSSLNGIDLEFPLKFEHGKVVLPKSVKNKLKHSFRFGEYSSDTKQLTLHSKKGWLRVLTPKTEAMVFDQEIPQMIALQVEKASVPALISVSSLDGNNILDSSRMLLMVVTDARNTGMEFERYHLRVRITKQGTFPVQIQPGIFELSLKNIKASKLKLFVLNNRGERNEELPTTYKEGTLHFSIDFEKLKHGPGFYFELVEIK